MTQVSCFEDLVPAHPARLPRCPACEEPIDGGASLRPLSLLRRNQVRHHSAMPGDRERLPMLDTAQNLSKSCLGLRGLNLLHCAVPTRCFDQSICCLRRGVGFAIVRPVRPFPSIRFRSSPSREAGRCQEYGFIEKITKTFQSSPSREAGRCDPHRPMTAPIWEFQSSPSREAGRCSYSLIDVGKYVIEFQSSPSREAGRCIERRLELLRRLVVSILAQP